MLTTRTKSNIITNAQKVLSMKLFKAQQEEMLEFCKKVLTNVSFDRKLFKKELSKAIKWVNKEEMNQLKKWCVAKFGHIYGDIISDTFRLLPA